MMPAARRIRRLNRRDSPPGRSLVSADLTADEIPATGGHHRFALENDTEFKRVKVNSLDAADIVVSA